MVAPYVRYMSEKGYKTYLMLCAKIQMYASEFAECIRVRTRNVTGIQQFYTVSLERGRWGGGGGVAQHKGLQLNNCLFFFSINPLYYHFLFVVVTQIRSRIHKYIKSKSYSE